MFAITNIPMTHKVNHNATYKNVEGDEVTLIQGERVKLFKIKCIEDRDYFAVEKTNKGLIVFPIRLFYNNFKQFQWGI